MHAPPEEPRQLPPQWIRPQSHASAALRFRQPGRGQPVKANQAAFVVENQRRQLERDSLMLALVLPVLPLIPFVAHCVYTNRITFYKSVPGANRPGSPRTGLRPWGGGHALRLSNGCLAFGRLGNHEPQWTRQRRQPHRRWLQKIFLARCTIENSGRKAPEQGKRPPPLPHFCRIPLKIHILGPQWRESPHSDPSK